VAQLFLPSLTQRPRLVVGIEAVGDFEELRRDAAVVVENAVAYGETVFVTQLVPGTGGLSDYFLANRAPFYRRSGASAGDRLPRQR
jgi:hypothetical protein